MKRASIHLNLSQTAAAAVMIVIFAAGISWSAAGTPSAFASDTNQVLERTCFQTGAPWSPKGNLGSDVAIVYGIDTNLPARIET